MDDLKIGLTIRALRRRRELTQAELADLVNVSQATLSRIERGRIARVEIASLRAVCLELEAEFVSEVRWHGAARDRLLDERHAALCGEWSTSLQRAAWQTVPEATFQIYGERGSIDVLAGHAATRTVAISEIKSDVGSAEETLRRLDVKTRLATRIAEERFGWRPKAVCRILVVMESSTNRDRIARLAPLFDGAFPVRTLALRHWLREPVGSISALTFVRLPDAVRARIGPAGRDRVRHPRTAGRCSEIVGS